MVRRCLSRIYRTRRCPREKRLALALEFAISALNDAPSFRTHVERAGRPLSSYQLLPLLETVLRDDAPER